MDRFKTAVKNVLAAFLFASGFFSLLIRFRLKRKCIVLMYHRVIPKSLSQPVHSHPGIVVSVDLFDLHMRWLKTWMRPISLSSFLEHVERGQDFPDRSCLVTFDDGWLDNYDEAFPILTKHEIPAAVFLPVDYISTGKVFWQEEMTMLIQNIIVTRDRDKRSRLAEILQPGRQLTNLEDRELRSIVTGFKTSDYETIASVIERLRALCGSGGDADHYNRYLSWDQVLEMRETGIEFGSHAKTHRMLNKLSREECLSELSESKRIMENQLEQPVEALAYPNGNFDSGVIENARLAGYKIAFTTLPGVCGAESDPMALPRINIHDNNSTTAARFMTTITGMI